MSRPTRRSDLASRLRHSGLGRWLAVVLLLFQVVLATDHLGASAAAAFGVDLRDEALGILSMCHGDGSLDVADTDDGVPATAPVPPCVLCTVAALAGVGLTSMPPMAASPAPVVLAEMALPVVVAVPVRSPLRYGTGRGPPLPVV